MSPAQISESLVCLLACCAGLRGIAGQAKQIFGTLSMAGLNEHEAYVLSILRDTVKAHGGSADTLWRFLETQPVELNPTFDFSPPSPPPSPSPAGDSSISLQLRQKIKSAKQLSAVLAELGTTADSRAAYYRALARIRSSLEKQDPFDWAVTAAALATDDEIFTTRLDMDKIADAGPEDVFAALAELYTDQFAQMLRIESADVIVGVEFVQTRLQMDEYESVVSLLEDLMSVITLANATNVLSDTDFREMRYTLHSLYKVQSRDGLAKAAKPVKKRKAARS